MADVIITGNTYKLRAGSPMPIGTGVFVTHTFMAEDIKVDNYLYTQTLKSSAEFLGQGGPYTSASFSRLMDKGGETFAGKVSYQPVFVNENFII